MDNDCGNVVLSGDVDMYSDEGCCGRMVGD